MVFFLKKTMKKAYRVKKNEDYQTIIKKKKSVASRDFVVYYDSNVLSHARVGISVSKKLGKATIRNKIKRQVREIARTSFDFDQSMDYLIIVRQHYLYQTFDENKQDLIRLQRKILSKNIGGSR